MDHSTTPFYNSKETRVFDGEERKGIAALFANAAQNSVRIVPIVLSTENIVRFLSHGAYAIIVLVNSTLLKCKACNPTTLWKTVSVALRRNFICQARESTRLGPTKYKRLNDTNATEYAPEFVGHYIVLFGHDNRADDILYIDPGVTHKQCRISIKAFESARASLGTDYDLIVVRLGK